MVLKDKNKRTKKRRYMKTNDERKNEIISKLRSLAELKEEIHSAVTLYPILQWNMKELKGLMKGFAALSEM